jgi:hypothetical protein
VLMVDAPWIFGPLYETLKPLLKKYSALVSASMSVLRTLPAPVSVSVNALRTKTALVSVSMQLQCLQLPMKVGRNRCSVPHLWR